MNSIHTRGYSCAGWRQRVSLLTLYLGCHVGIFRDHALERFHREECGHRRPWPSRRGCVWEHPRIDICRGTSHLSDSEVAFQLLIASDYLQLRTDYVEDRCFQYLEENDIRVQSETLSRYFRSLASRTGNDSLIYFDRTHIRLHITYFAAHEDVLEMNFEVLKEILLKFRGIKYPSYESGNDRLRMVLSWVNRRSRRERFQYQMRN